MVSGGLKFSERARADKFARWEQAGLEAVAADLHAGGGSIVGSGVQERALAEEWFQIKHAEKAAALERLRRSEVSPPSGAKAIMLPLLDWLWQMITFR